ncbi:MAG: Carboxypeptidase regulatory-like domain [Phycisphaerales bacterium]|nr:Carboxypeptidase regulatory-like domain [Phycisphaerales bacterium]
MVRMFKWMAPAVATLGLMFAVTTAKAADEKPAATGGTVTGTVVDKDGKAVEGVKIRIMKPMQRGGAGGAGGAAPKVADAPAEKPAAGAGGRQRPAPVAEGTSDKEGKFSIANVPAGDYAVMAVQQGAGMARSKVTVKDGETVSVDLKLAERPAGAGAGGAGGRRGRGGAGAGAPPAK